MNAFDILLRAFPDTGADYPPIGDDVEFDPARHLCLEQPAEFLTLADFGYGEEIAGTTPSAIAATSCFRVLSEEGVEAMLHVCRQLEAFTTSNPRVARNARGGTYRSRFLREFSLSPELTEHLSGLLRTPLIPHAIPHQLSHLNFAPIEVGASTSQWHYDTLQADMVMFVTDPQSVDGGQFRYFRGTRDEMAALHEADEPIPEARIHAPEMPGPGHAIVMQGNYVVHQAGGLRSPGERITLVNGYTYADMDSPDYTALHELMHVDDAGIISAEYARHVALRCGRLLQQAVNAPNYALSPQQQAEYLRRVRTELDDAIGQLEWAEGPAMRNFGG